MAKRLVRAKRKIAHAAIPFRLPQPDRIAERTTGVLAVLYLLFNQGYRTSGRQELCAEAIRLGRATRELLPHDQQVTALLALMLLQHSRRGARRDAQGVAVLLQMQDRNRWNAAEIAEGLKLLQRDGDSAAGFYRVQAHIAACHATARTYEATDWRAILSSYDTLMQITQSPVVELNRAVALAEVHGPHAALRLLDGLIGSGQLSRYEPLWSARAELRQRVKDFGGAAADLECAMQLANTDDRRGQLRGWLAELAPSGAFFSRSAGLDGQVEKAESRTTAAADGPGPRRSFVPPHPRTAPQSTPQGNTKVHTDLHI